MKSSAITRIIIWSLVAVILTGVLAWGLLARGFFGFSLPLFRSSSKGGSYGAGSFAAAEVDEVHVEWISGKVTIQEGANISFEEHSNRSLDEDEQLCYRLSGRTLYIEYTTRHYWFGNAPSKDLELTLPRQLSKLKLELVSADVSMDGDFVIDEVDVETVSGRIGINQLSSRDIAMETVSGKMELTIGTVPEEIDLDSVSGSMTLYWPTNAGFTAELESVSGDVESDFATTSRNGKIMYDDGHTKIDGNSVSGDLIIRQQ